VTNKFNPEIRVRKSIPILALDDINAEEYLIFYLTLGTCSSLNEKHPLIDFKYSSDNSVNQILVMPKLFVSPTLEIHRLQAMGNVYLTR